jgi:hypothetical protein
VNSALYSVARSKLAVGLEKSCYMTEL